MISVLLALLAAGAAAAGVVLQQKGTLETQAEASDPRFFAEVFHRRAWRAGGACQAAGLLLQAGALSTGSLVVVQCVMATNLVIALPLGRRLTNQTISRRVWLAAFAIVLGLVLFLSTAAPTGGTSTPPAAAWWPAALAASIVVLVLAAAGRKPRGALRALLLGGAAGVAFAVQASMTKVFVVLSGRGFNTVLSSWSSYGLITSTMVGFALWQAALKSGVLAPAIASYNAVTLLASVVFGLAVFGETLSTSGGRLLPVATGLAVTMVGMVRLAGAPPPTGI